MIALVMFIAYVLVGCFFAWRIRSYLRASGHKFDSLDCLMIVALWPYYLIGGR